MSCRQLVFADTSVADVTVTAIVQGEEARVYLPRVKIEDHCVVELWRRDRACATCATQSLNICGSVECMRRPASAILVVALAWSIAPYLQRAAEALSHVVYV